MSLLFELPPATPTAFCRTCQHKQRIEYGIRNSNRTGNGKLKILCKTPACSQYEAAAPGAPGLKPLLVAVCLYLCFSANIGHASSCKGQALRVAAEKISTLTGRLSEKNSHPQGSIFSAPALTAAPRKTACAEKHKHMQQLPVIKTFKPNHTERQPHDLYLLSKGDNAGKPLAEPCPNCFVMRCSSEQERQRFHYLAYALWQSDSFYRVLVGSCVQFIRIDELKRCLSKALRSVEGHEADFDRAISLVSRHEQQQAAINQHFAQVLTKGRQLLGYFVTQSVAA